MSDQPGICARRQEIINKVTKKEELSRLIRGTPVSGWVKEMYEHHQKTGQWRNSDLLRILGDPTQGIFIGDKITSTELSPTIERLYELANNPHH